MNSEMNNKSVNVVEHAFEMPECVFCATCGSCKYYGQYAFGKAYCNYHKQETSASDEACGAYE